MGHRSLQQKRKCSSRVAKAIKSTWAFAPEEVLDVGSFPQSGNPATFGRKVRLTEKGKP
jgi:hypothetical protein